MSNRFGKCKHCGRECRLRGSYCAKHYNQLRKYGKFLDKEQRNILDPNEIVLYDDYAELVLYDRNSKEIARTKIDLDDVDLVRQYNKWHVRKRKRSTFVVTTVKSKEFGDTDVSLSRLVFGALKSKRYIVHINGDLYDNRKSNLKLETRRNHCLRIAKDRNTSGYLGIYRRSSNGKWYATVGRKPNRKEIGKFDTLDEAVVAQTNEKRRLRREKRKNNK